MTGGWKGCAAFGYLLAEQRSAIEAMEFAVSYSDEEDNADADNEDADDQW